jgi:hypothetical protein
VSYEGIYSRFSSLGCINFRAFSLLVVYNGAFMVPFPYNEKFGVIAGSAAVSLFFAWLSSTYWEDATGGHRQTVWEVALKPPIILWAIAVVPPAIGAGSAILGFTQTGKWAN